MDNCGQMKINDNFGIRFGGENYPKTAIICPACNDHVSIKELLEKKGYLACVRCSR